MDETIGIEENQIHGKDDSAEVLVKIIGVIAAITTILTIVDVFMYEKTNSSSRKNYYLVVLLLSFVTLLGILIILYKKLYNIYILLFAILYCLLLLWVNYTIYADGNLTSIESDLKSLINTVVVAFILIVIFLFMMALASLYMPAGDLRIRE